MQRRWARQQQLIKQDNDKSLLPAETKRIISATPSFIFFLIVKLPSSLFEKYVDNILDS